MLQSLLRAACGAQLTSASIAASSQDLNGPSAGGHMDGNPVPGIALRQRPRPILRALALMDDGNHRPWHAGFDGNGLISGSWQTLGPQ